MTTYCIRFGLQLLCLFWIIQLSAQVQNNVWYFGQNAGIDFNSGTATPFLGNIVANEGSASVCDKQGQLLFYTNGQTIWDRNENSMPNGNGLEGGASSTQVALIVPQPESGSLYYVFTTDDHLGDRDLTYSIVDMCLNHGLGDVIPGSKNVVLSSNASEKLTAIQHGNERDIWIVTHDLSSNRFVTYLLTPMGLELNPVISSIGSFHNSMAFVGPVKASHRGDKIVCSATFHGICDMFDFDRFSGSISNHTNLDQQYVNLNFVYGIEFSPDDSKLYISTCFSTCYLHQIDLETQTQVTLHSITGNYIFGALQLAPDGKIYMARDGQSYLGVIASPDQPGMSCAYSAVGLGLASGSRSRLGLPNLIPFAIEDELFTLGNLVQDTLICEGDSVELTVVTDLQGQIQYFWSDSLTEPTRFFHAPGQYWVEVTNGCETIRDSVRIQLLSSPSLLSDIDTTFCQGQSVIIYPGQGYTSFTWSDGSTNPNAEFWTQGQWAVTVSNACGSDSMVIQTSVIPVPAIDLGPDTNLCVGQTILLDAEYPGSTYEWSDGSSFSQIQVMMPGVYAVSVQNECGQMDDSIVIGILPIPMVSLPMDTTKCIGDPISLYVTSEASTVIWSDLSSGTDITITSPGWYWAEVTNECGSTRDSVYVTDKDCAYSIYIPNVFTPNGDGTNDYFLPFIEGETIGYTMDIFDRWGNMVYHGNNTMKGWDGSFNGKELMPGVFACIIRLHLVGDTVLPYKTDVTLIR